MTTASDTRPEVRRRSTDAPHVAVLTIEAMAGRALLTRAAIAGLVAHLAKLEEDDDVKAVVLGGATPDLCLGLDLNEAAGLYPEPGGRPPGKHPSLRARLAAHDRLFWGADGLYARLARFPKVTVLAATGRCHGPGLYLALCADLVVAGRTSRFGNPRWRHLGADGDLMMLINAVGLKRARSAVFCGTEWVGEDARRVGLVDAVVPDEQVAETAVDLAAAAAHVIRDGIAAEKYLAKAAIEKAHVGTGFAIATLMGAMASNIHFRPGELNVLRERRHHGTSAAVRSAAAVGEDRS